MEEQSRFINIGGCFLWLFGIMSISLTVACSVVLILLVAISLAINVWLGLQASGVEVVVNVPATPAGDSTSAEAQALPNPFPQIPLPPPPITFATTEPTPASEEEPAAEAQPAPPSDNQYTLIPIEGERESRPPAEHGDLNLKLRDPQPLDVELNLVEIENADIDPHAPKLSTIFEPNFVAAYAIHDWDWNCNCKGALIQEENYAVVVEIATTPGTPIRIPARDPDIYEGRFYAVVLYASPDSLTFSYARTGTVASGYVIHYEGIQTDPNLLALFESSEGNQLPGLTLDTPIGIAKDSIIIAVRDKGTFLDARSRLGLWE